jgi:trigger factor
MQVSVEDVSSLTKKMTITLPQDYVSQRLEDAYKKLASEVSLKGFRKGKIPRKVLEKNYGPKVEYDVAEKMIQDTYFDALEKSSLDAVVHPEVKEQKFAEDGSFIYQAEIDIKPQYELQEYKGIEIEQPEIVVSDKEVEAELQRLRRQMAPLRNVEERGIQKEDMAIIDFQGYHNETPMKQVKGENFAVEVGSGNYGMEFEEKLVGLKKGEDASLEVDFPEGFNNPVLAGKKVEFKIKVKEVKERSLPDLDDEFAQEVGKEFKTLDDLKNQIRQNIQKVKEGSQESDMGDQLMKKLLDLHEFDIPRRLVAYEIDSLIKELEGNLQRQGMTLESAGMNREALAEQYQQSAESRVRGDFILKKAGEKEGIKLEKEDIERGFQRVARQYNMQVDEVKKYFQHRDYLLPFMNELLSEKILRFLVSQAKIVRVPAEKAAEASS